MTVSDEELVVSGIPLRDVLQVLTKIPCRPATGAVRIGAAPYKLFTLDIRELLLDDVPYCGFGIRPRSTPSPSAMEKGHNHDLHDTRIHAVRRFTGIFLKT